MRKLVKVLLVALLAMSLFACGGSFEKDKDAIVDKLYKYAENCNTVGNGLNDIITVTGPYDWYTYLERICMIDSPDSAGFSDVTSILDEEGYFDHEKINAIEAYTDEIFGTNMVGSYNKSIKNVEYNKQKELAGERIYEFVQKYLSALASLEVTEKTLPEEIKTFKEKYSKKHEELVETIVDYYLLCTEYYDFVNKPSGTVSQFSKQIKTYQNDLENLQRKIELE